MMTKQKGCLQRCSGGRVLSIFLVIILLLIILLSGRQEVQTIIVSTPFGTENPDHVDPSVKQLLSQQLPAPTVPQAANEATIVDEVVASRKISKTFESPTGTDENLASSGISRASENNAGKDDDAVPLASSMTASGDEDTKPPGTIVASPGGVTAQLDDGASSTGADAEASSTKLVPGLPVASLIRNFVKAAKDEMDAAFKGHVPFLLHIGAGNGQAFYEPLKSLISDAKLHAVFVEANPHKFKELQRNLQRHFGGTNHEITAFNVAICPQAYFGTKHGKKANKHWSDSLYVLNANFASKYPDKPHGLSSKSHSKMLEGASALGLSKDDISQFIEKIKVECVTPEAFFGSKHYLDGAEAKRLRFLEVDGAGVEHNVGVLDSFTHLAGFHPKILFVGGHDYSKTDLQVLKKVAGQRRMAYQVHNEMVEGHFVAFAPSHEKTCQTCFAEELVNKIAMKSARVHVLQIGACDGDFNSTTSNDPLQKILSRSNIEAVLIEPNPPMFRTLQKNVRLYLGETSRVRALNMAICPKESKEVPFFVISPRFAKDYPKAPHWAKYQVSSLRKDQVLKHWETLGIAQGDWEKYVEELQVPCKTPKDLLDHVTVKASDVQILEVDAEGFDGRIVSAFLELPGFAPSVIIFEIVHLMPKEVHELQRRFKALGYKEMVARGNAVMWKDPADVT